MTERISQAELKALQGKKKQNKHKNKAEFVDERRFASKAEAARYRELMLLVAAGRITNLVLQPRFPIVIGGIKVCTYVGDFQYRELPNCKFVVEDVKGQLLPIYKLKKKLMLAVKGISITEILSTRK